MAPGAALERYLESAAVRTAQRFTDDATSAGAVCFFKGGRLPDSQSVTQPFSLMPTGAEE